MNANDNCLDKKFLGLITRCKDEFFVGEFCKYYLSQGVDLIYIIDDDSNDKSIYDNIKKNHNVNVIFKKNVLGDGSENSHEMDEVNNLYREIKNDFVWIISVDVDEFITTKKNIKKTIKDELKTTFKDADCIKVPWVMMSCNNKEKNPKSILRENVYRWNHDKKHRTHPLKKNWNFRCRYNETEVKCIFKSNKWNKIAVHYPKYSVGNCKIVDSINNHQQKVLYRNHSKLRESDIKEGYLLCYHYRIISVENCKKKIKNSIETNNPVGKLGYGYITLKDMMKSDFPEVYDETLKIKINNIGGGDGK
tara:strand:+ start:444 stop:1361 length:918 start_codon:yes stop_codon:yes gene_type:complete